MRLLNILLIVVICHTSFAQLGKKDNLKEHRNVFEMRVTANFIPNFNTLTWNGWGDNKFHTAIFAYSYKRRISSKWHVGVNYSHLWTLSQNSDNTILPQQTDVIGKNLTTEVGCTYNNVLHKLDISTALF